MNSFLFLEIVIIVKPVQLEGKIHYRVQVLKRRSVEPFGPLKYPALFAQDIYMGGFIATKGKNFFFFFHEDNFFFFF